MEIKTGDFNGQDIGLIEKRRMNNEKIKFKQSMILLEKKDIKELELMTLTRHLCDTMKERCLIESKKGIIRNIEKSIESLKGKQ